MKELSKKVIKFQLEVIKKQCFTEEYQDKVTPSEAMGMLLSHYFDWDGIAILESAMYALEDANFHSECAQIAEMLDKIKHQAQITKNN